MECLFLFDPTLGREETEHEKILYYHPHETPLNRQCSFVGLAEGLSGFTKTFCKTEPVSLCRTSNLTFSFINPEPNVWMVMGIKNSALVQAKGKDKKPNKDTPEPTFSRYEDCMLRSCMERMYELYTMFNWRINRPDHSVDVRRRRLSAYMDCLLPHFNFTNMSFIQTLHAVDFMSCESQHYAMVHQTLQAISGMLPDTRIEGLVVYRNKLVDTTMGPEATHKLHSYLTEFMYTPDGASQKQGREDPMNQASLPDVTDPNTAFPINLFSEWDMQNVKGFVTPTPERYVKLYLPRVRTTPAKEASEGQGAAAETKAEGVEAPPPVENEKMITDDEYILTVYHVNKLVVCLLVDAKAQPERVFNEVIPEALVLLEGDNPPISDLTPHFNDCIVRSESLEDVHRYVYYNHLNMVVKTSSHLKWTAFSEAIKHILNTIHADFVRMSHISEVSAKTQNDGWVAARRHGERYFYIVFDQKFSNSIEIHDELARMDREYFSHIFIAS
eukprot:c5443_g1_i1.p1 GENE.c5443_g1_i1~~c5443_g1_i1.p1  ORF type:complete len:500 (+),score=128.32 c5443_g1_i1:50-1549(+)